MSEGADTTRQPGSEQAPAERKNGKGNRPRRRRRRSSSLQAYGEPWVWLTGGALAICLAMIIGLLCFVFYNGLVTFWPVPIERFTLDDGSVHMGEATRDESYTLTEAELEALDGDAASRARKLLDQGDGRLTRRLVRTGNYELTNVHFSWVDEHLVAKAEQPEWAVLIERTEWGRFYGEPTRFLIDGEAAATEPQAVWDLYLEHRPDVQRRIAARDKINSKQIGHENYRIRKARLSVARALRKYGEGSAEHTQAVNDAETVNVDAATNIAALTAEAAKLDQENDRFQIELLTASGHVKAINLDEIVRAYPANQLGFGDRLSVYVSRWWEFIADEPREANSEGGVAPAIVGTVVMTLIMTLAVVPLGVLAALYLREYAKPGTLVSIVRISINNLAGVPSIVFGVFGLHFFCYTTGVTIDQLLFQDELPNPTFGKGGLLWASLTLALLTLPVVIVATEEALAAVPSSMREGSYACGGSKWQTIKRIVLPRAMPGIMTGAILAMARGAGEVAPLMLVGAVKIAPHWPVDLEAPFVHPSRSFMHLGFHIFDLGFQSQNSEASRGMVYTTTLLLILLITMMNVSVIYLRNRLRRKFATSQF